MKKKIEKLKEDATETKNEKRQKIPSDINFPRRTTTLSLKKFDLRANFLKKVSLDAQNPLQGGLVYGNVTKVNF